jgi:transposase
MIGDTSVEDMTVQTEEQPSSTVCFKCGKTGKNHCRVCGEFFCELHGNAEDSRCGKCDEDYSF